MLVSTHTKDMVFIKDTVGRGALLPVLEENGATRRRVNHKTAIMLNVVQ